MAIKTFYVTRDMKHPLYRNRMLRAGEPLELDAPTARLYTQLKAISPDAPVTAKAATAPAGTPPPATVATAAPKRTPRKRAAKKAK